jgi:hypothetical protein
LSQELKIPSDVQVLNYAPLGFKLSVLRNGKLLFSYDEKVLCDLIENVSLEYIPFYHISLEELMR